MKSNDYDRRAWWLVVASAVAIGALAGLAVLAWFLTDQGRESSDRWANIIALSVTVLAAVVPVVGWMIRQGLKSPDLPGKTAVVGRLRQAVSRMWTQEVATRHAHLPRPLRLRWRPTLRPNVQVGQGTGELRGALLSADDARPPADALAAALRDPTVRQLVMLGEPGAGKTTLAILYVVAAIDTARSEDPVPVPLPVAGWDPNAQQGIEDWVAQRICQDYPQVTKIEARWLVGQRKVIPVLDGLDEMPATERATALVHLEQAAGRGLRMMLTCRGDEYAQATAEVGVLPQAVVVDVEPVDVDDAVTYLTQREPAGSTRWGSVIAAMTTDRNGPLATALSTPLMIAVTRQVYLKPATDPTELTTLATAEAIQQRILNRFLPSVYGTERTAARAGQRLAFLIHHLPAHPRDPNLYWWRLAAAVSRVTLGALVTAAVTVLGTLLGLLGLVFANDYDAYAQAAALGAALGFWVGLVTGLHTARAAHAPDQASRGMAWLSTIAAGFGDAYAAAAVLSTLSAAVLVATYSLAAPKAVAFSIAVVDVMRALRAGDTGIIGLTLVIVSLVAITIVVANGLGVGRAGAPRQSAPRLRDLPRRLLPALGMGLLVGLPWTALGALHMLELDLEAGPAFTALITGLIGVPLGLGRWLSSPVPQPQDTSSPRLALRSDRTALLVTVGGVTTTTWLTIALVFWTFPGFGGDAEEAIIIATFFSIAVGALVLFGSDAAWLSYTVARLWLALRGRLPWRLMGFLRDAHRKGVLRQAGAAYQIRHDLIRTHLAQHWPVGGNGQEPAANPLSRSNRRLTLIRRQLLILFASTAAITSLPATAFVVAQKPYAIGVDLRPVLAKRCPPLGVSPERPNQPVPDVPAGPRTVDATAGISYKSYGAPWEPWNEAWVSQDELEIIFSAGQHIVTEPNYDGAGSDYHAVILSANAPAAIGEGFVLDLKCIGEQIAADMRITSYPTPNRQEMLKEEYATLGGRRAWVLKLRLHFTKPGLRAKSELASIAVVDIGRAKVAIVYVSIPDTHRQLEYLTNEVLESIRPTA